MLLEFLAYLEAHGHDALVFAPGEGDQRCRGFRVVRVRGLPFPLYPGLVLAPHSTQMGPLLREWQPDVVHLAGPFVLGMQGLAVGRSLGVLVAAHYQTDLPRYAEHFGLGALAGLAWRRLLDIHNACDVNFAPTPSVAAELRARGMQRVQVCGRGVDADLFSPLRRDAAYRAGIMGAEDRPILLYVGRLSPEKNLGTLAAVARALPGYPLLIVGDGPARSALAADLHGLDARFTGVLAGEELARAYASSDVLLCPSSTETFGQVVREAMAARLPVVGKRAGGVRDLIRDGETGILCPPDDEAAFVAATRRLAEDEALRRAMGAAARREAEQHSWKYVFDHLLGWYAGLASLRRVSGVAAGGP
jgi:glycosyltransferase involved in cell wall biosynthesis